MVPAQAQKTVKAVLDAEIQVLDPIATTSYATRTFAYLVYDTLISMDSKGNYRPQMLESFSASPNRMVYTFTLRPGLEWSDGTPVTAADCVASINRWGARDGMGKQLLAATKAINAVNASTFTIELSKPFGFVVEALGKPSSNVPVMMPARLAGTEATKPVSEVVGSGPFLFRRDKWVPGSRMVLEKNPRYKPRPEPADGLAGGKHVHVDAVEILSMPEPATQVAALQAGEIDYVQYTPYDFIPVLRSHPQVTVDGGSGLANFMGGVRPNHLQPPFNNVKVRQALQALMVQGDIVRSIGMPVELMLPECTSMFMCNAPFSSTAGTERLKGASVEKARALLKEAGYKGEKVVVLHASDVPAIHLSATAIEDLMRRAGFNVEVQTMDWATVAQRRASKEPVDKGGWSLLPVIWAGHDLATPLTHYGIAYNCSDGYAGWSCDEEITKLMPRFIDETDLARRKAIVDQIQQRAHENVSITLWGQFVNPASYRKSLKGVLNNGIPVFWNIQK
jgi:peptide/nickel transport system substrate-binding protein